MSLDIDRLQNLGNKRKEISEKQSKLIELKPINQDVELDKVKKAYSEGKEYNPVFQYRSPKADRLAFLEEIQEFIRSLQPSSSSLQGKLEIALWNVGLEIYLQEQSRVTKDAAHLTASSIYLEGMPRTKLVNDARSFLEKHKDDKSEYDGEPLLPSPKLLSYCQRFLSQFGFDDWQVVLTRDISSPTVVDRTPHKRIRLLTSHEFTPTQFANLITRTIVTGIGRAENGEENEVASLMFNGFASYQSTEFGLRNFLVEKVTGNREIARSKVTAARYVAVYEALNGSFFKAFSSVVDYVDVEKALEIVTRIKRGLTNTKEPGGYLKDIIYWQGYHAVKEHLSDKPEDLAILYTGKIGLDDIPLVRELIDAGYVKLPKRSPEDMMKFARIMADELRETLQSPNASVPKE